MSYLLSVELNTKEDNHWSGTLVTPDKSSLFLFKISVQLEVQLHVESDLFCVCNVSMKSLFIFPLFGFAFQGVIRDEEDLNMLGSEFKDMYTKRQIDPFDDSGWDSKK